MLFRSPHPFLKSELYKLWGKEKTDKYYECWNQLPNCSINLDSYIELFNESDAMILDSGSFSVEYLFTGKPSLFCYKNDKVVTEFNFFGKEALKMHYGCKSTDDIDEFINNIVVNGNDFMKDKRTAFYYEKLVPPNSSLANENIYNFLKEKLLKKRKGFER